MTITRCAWANKSELVKTYHDSKWGKPLHDEQELFKMLCLEGMQAGLSWSLILTKHDNLCEAFADFDPHVLVTYDEQKIEELLQNEGIIRNRLKINSVVHNARHYFVLCEKYGSLDDFLWSFVDHEPIINNWESESEIPASTPLSEAISKQLKKEGFKFIGPVIVYSLLQAVGIVNDHVVDCSFRFN